MNQKYEAEIEELKKDKEDLKTENESVKLELNGLRVSGTLNLNNSYKNDGANNVKFTMSTDLDDDDEDNSNDDKSDDNDDNNDNDNANCYVAKIILKYKNNKIKIHCTNYNSELAKPIKCPICAFTIKSKNHYNITKHFKKHLLKRSDGTITDKFQCHICQQVFVKMEGLIQHLNKSHDDAIKCDHCSRLFKSRSDCNTHMRMLHLKVQ